MAGRLSRSLSSMQNPTKMADFYFKMRLLPFFICTFFLAGLAQYAFGGNIYTFRDASGNVLFTNVVDSHKKPVGAGFRQYTTLEKIEWFKDTNVHRYNNWGKDEYAIRAGFSKNRHAYDNIIKTAALANKVDDGLVKAIIHTESGFNPYALSKPGAQGLMQLMPATAAMYKVGNAFDPDENIRAGTRHLRYLIDHYKNLELALAAYNAGEGNVDKYHGIPPFAETQDYVKRVLSRYRHLYGGPATTLADLSPALP